MAISMTKKHGILKLSLQISLEYLHGAGGPRI